MAINFTRLGTRLGHIIAGLNEVNTFRLTTLGTRVTDIAGDYASVNPSIPTAIYTNQDAVKSGFSGWLAYLGTLVQAVIINEVKNDRPLSNPSLFNSLVELRRQMVVAGESFNVSLCTIGAVTVVGSQTSNSQFVTTSKDGTGVAQDLIVPDSYLIRVSADSERGATMYAETMTLVGKPKDANATDDVYPSGSGIDTTVSIVDPGVAGGKVTDPNFSTWTVANTPDSWPITSGIAGTNVFRVTDDPRDGSLGTCLRLLSTASSTLKVRQAMDLKPNTVYAYHFKVKPVATGSSTAANVSAKLQLTDGAGTVLADDAGTNNAKTSSTFAGVAPGTGWNHGYSGVFITPTTLPSTGVYLEVSFTADAAGSDVYIDHVNLKELTPLYVGGPYFHVWSGKSAAVYLDTWTWAITLTTGAIGDYVVRGLDRLIDLKSIGVRMTTNASPTIADAVIA